MWKEFGWHLTSYRNAFSAPTERTLLVVWFWNKTAFLDRDRSLITAWSYDWGFPYDRCRGHTCRSARILTLISLTSWFTCPGLFVICKMEVNRIFLSASEGSLAPVLVRVLQTKWHTEKETSSVFDYYKRVWPCGVSDETVLQRNFLYVYSITTASPCVCDNKQPEVT